MLGQQPGNAPGLRLWTRPSPPPNQVRFSRPESEQARQRRVQSYEFLQKKHAEEPWVHLHYYGLRVSWGPWAVLTQARVGSWEKSPSAWEVLPGGLIVSHLTSFRFSCRHLVVPQGERLSPVSSLSSLPT